MGGIGGIAKKLGGPFFGTSGQANDIERRRLADVQGWLARAKANAQLGAQAQAGAEVQGAGQGARAFGGAAGNVNALGSETARLIGRNMSGGVYGTTARALRGVDSMLARRLGSIRGVQANVALGRGARLGEIGASGAGRRLQLDLEDTEAIASQHMTSGNRLFETLSAFAPLAGGILGGAGGKKTSTAQSSSSYGYGGPLY